MGIKWFEDFNLRDFLLKHFLIITEVIAVILAVLWPLPGSKLSNSTISLAIVAVIFLFTGFKLKTDELKSVVKCLDVVIVCCISSLFITSLLPGYIVTALPFDDKLSGVDDSSFSLGPVELRLGITLFYCAPATVATGIVMVTTAEGDVVTAVAVSTITNLLGCLTMPLLFSLFADADTMAQDGLKIFYKLALSLLLPLIVGKVVTTVIPKSRSVVAKYKRYIGLFQSFCICFILWIKLSSSIEKGTFKLLNATDLVILAAILIVCHLFVFFLNFLTSIVCCFKREQASVIMLLCSQKTMVLTTAIATALPEQIGDSALILLPCFIAHPLQMLIDSFFIQPLRTSTLFPVFLPEFCRKYRYGTEENAAVVENPVATELTERNED